MIGKVMESKRKRPIILTLSVLTLVNYSHQLSLSASTTRRNPWHINNRRMSIKPLRISSVTSSGSSSNSNSEDGANQPSSKRNINIESDENENDAPTAPEVNTWTTIMTDPNAFNNGLPNENNDGSITTNIYTALTALTDDDYQQIETYWDKLMPHVSYLGTENAHKVKISLKVAYCAHRSQKRKSGEPFIIHPVEVSILLAGLQMDAETVMAGLLHDTVEDTDLTFPQIEDMFGPIVKTIVEGETKVSKLPRLAFEDYADEQAENLRQMFVAMTDDYRIIIVKLADRLHNMRTLRFMKPEKQLKISKETLEIFAPLAHRMGIWQFKSELEDTSFMYLYPAEYKRLNRRLRRHQKKFRETLDRSKEILEKTLNSDPTLREQKVQTKVWGRRKELYSLWHKMEAKGEHNLDHINDVVALRVVIEPQRDENNAVDDSDAYVWLCYHVLGLVQHLPGFQPVPTKVKDYISFPKPNGYQSLHTSLMMNGQTIEVQIRTSAMHQIAEYGMASHWAYEDGKKRENFDELYNTPWLSSIKEWQDEVLCSRDFVDCVRRELLGKRVFVFLRNGKILNLAKGSTVIDAAFQIHTEVGLNMHGVEINGKQVDFSYELRNGDVVSVLTGNGKPATDWMKFARIRSTRSKLRTYFRRKQRENLRDAGAILLFDFLKMYGYLIKESSYLEEAFEVPTKPDEIAKFLPGKTQYNEVDDLLIDIGNSHDREFLRLAVAKLFLVPQRELASAEENRNQDLSTQILSVVKEKRKSAHDVGVALANGGEDYFTDELPNGKKNEKEQDNNSIETKQKGGFSDVVNKGSVANEDVMLPKTDEAIEIADPEFLCPHCLPIFGDDIIGTRPLGKVDEFETTVHRTSCPIALKAINVPPTISSPTSTNDNVDSKDKSVLDRLKPMGSLFPKIDAGAKNGKKSISKRLKARFKGSEQNSIEMEDSDVTEAVKLKWDDGSYMQGENFLYLTEISVIAMDRKYLLADCSEVVSDMSEIVKTGSLSTDEHAIFEFLVKVESLDHLQKLMNSLMKIRSVMSVERKFGSSG